MVELTLNNILGSKSKFTSTVHERFCYIFWKTSSFIWLIFHDKFASTHQAVETIPQKYLLITLLKSLKNNAISLNLEMAHLSKFAFPKYRIPDHKKIYA